MCSSDLEVLTIPFAADLVSGRLNISQIRSVAIEDLLGRDKVDLDNAGLKNLIQSKTVLISGAGGSIGAELCRQIISFKPRRLICLDISEIALYKIEQEFLNLNFNKGIYLVADVKNSARLKDVFSQFKPEIVFHAAAYKHVPLVEHNPSEGLQNNVLGTLNLAQVAKKHHTSHFVLISTDKAVRPTNVMGATKRFAELVLQALANEPDSKTCFSMVRFGNVLGSSGSVVPLFREQIKAGGPVTLTHAEVTRYFMTIPEAAQLVIQAGAMAQGGEVFVLDMGQPVRIQDLARRMIERTTAFPILKGVRGQRPVDLAELERILVRFSEIPVLQPAIAEIDVNPLLASPTGLCALDARVLLHPIGKQSQRPAIRPYPVHYVRPWRFADGSEVQIRPIRPDDEKIGRAHV